MHVYNTENIIENTKEGNKGKIIKRLTLHYNKTKNNYTHKHKNYTKPVILQ